MCLTLALSVPSAKRINSVLLFPCDPLHSHIFPSISLVILPLRGEIEHPSEIESKLFKTSLKLQIDIMLYDQKLYDWAVLKTPLSQVNWLMNWVTLSSKPSKHHYNQTVRARELTFWENVHPPLFVTCQMSIVRCHISCVMCLVSGVRCVMFCFFCRQSIWSSWWRVFYQRGRPCLVYIILFILLYMMCFSSSNPVFLCLHDAIGAVLDIYGPS